MAEEREETTQERQLRKALEALVKAVEDADNPRDRGLWSDAKEMVSARALLKGGQP